MSLRTRIIAILSLLGILALAPGSAHPPSDEPPAPPEDRILRVALQPMQGFVVPLLWLGMFDAQARHRPRRAVSLARQLLFLRPDSTTYWNDIVRWLAFTAPVPPMEARPPREEEALSYLLQAIELSRESLALDPDPRRFELLTLILLRLQTDEGMFGRLGLAYARKNDLEPLEELLRIGESLPRPLPEGTHRNLAHAWRARALALHRHGQGRAAWSSAVRSLQHAFRSFPHTTSEVFVTLWPLAVRPILVPAIRSPWPRKFLGSWR